MQKMSQFHMETTCFSTWFIDFLSRSSSNILLSVLSILTSFNIASMSDYNLIFLDSWCGFRTALGTRSVSSAPSATHLCRTAATTGRENYSAGLTTRGIVIVSPVIYTLHQGSYSVACPGISSDILFGQTLICLNRNIRLPAIKSFIGRPYNI